MNQAGNGSALNGSLQRLVAGFLYASPHQLLPLPPDNFFVSPYNIFGHGMLSLFRMVCRGFILPEICKPCLFICFFNLRNLFYPIVAISALYAAYSHLTNTQRRLVTNTLRLIKSGDFEVTSKPPRQRNDFICTHKRTIQIAAVGGELFR